MSATSSRLTGLVGLTTYLDADKQMVRMQAPRSQNLTRSGKNPVITIISRWAPDGVLG